VLYVGFCRANDNVEIQADVGVAEPRGVVRRETDGVVSCFVRGKRKSTVQGPGSLYDDVSRGLLL
jgi:hypothetical protein